MIKLNLGSGNNPKEGFINVDKFPPADVIVDLEKEIWPWPGGTAIGEIDEVLFHHSLEHMGAAVDDFFHIMKELYRVCKPDAKVVITVPHPRHDDFMNDPTHVRPITLNVLALFSKQNNEQWAKDETPNTPLALRLGVNFNIEKAEQVIETEYHGLPDIAIYNAIRKYNNVVKFMTFTLKVLK